MELSAFADLLGSIIGVAALAEALTEFAKLFVGDRMSQRADVATAAAIGIICALIFVHPGLATTGQNLVIQVLVGILASRGANYVHDLAKALRGAADLLKAAAAAKRDAP